MSADQKEVDGASSLKESQQGRDGGGRHQVQESSSVLEDQTCQGHEQPTIVLEDKEHQGHEQPTIMMNLPIEVLNHILSYTGTSAAVLAAGTAGMKTWFAANIAEWLIQRHGGMIGDDVPVDAMIAAIRHRLEKAVEVLSLRAGDPEDTALWGEVMQAAAQYGSVCIVNAVLKWSTDTQRTELITKLRNFMMAVACKSGQLQVVRALLDESQPHACRADGNDSRYLLTAVENGHVDVVRELLNPQRQHYALANVRSSQVLTRAAEKGHVNVMLELLDTLRPNHAKANDDNCQALQAAAASGQLECLRLLLDTSRESCASANVNDNIPMKLAALKGHHQVVRELLDISRPNHAVADANNSIALMYASDFGHAEVLRELLWQEQNPADPRSAMGDTALEKAIDKGNLACCRLLLGYPALPPRSINPALLKKAEKSSNWEVTALVKEVDRRYNSATGSWPMLQTAEYTLFGMVIVNMWFGIKTPCPKEAIVWFQCCGVALVLVLLTRIYYKVFGPSNLQAAEKQAALQDAEYRAAWYKANER